MRRRFYKFSTWVILSAAKDLTQGSLITLGEQGDASSVGEVPHFIRDNPRSRGGVLFTTCR